MKKKIILASSSPRRKELLAMAGIPFTVDASPVPEIVPEGLAAEKQSAFLAEVKAAAVSVSHPQDVVIGADTTVICEGRVMGKPKDAEEAREMLAFLSGKIHTVYTGVSVIYSDDADAETFTSATKVEFYPLSQKVIDEYVATGEPLDKAGAYGIQGRGCRLVKRIEGDYFTVMGLPVAELLQRLEKLAKKGKFSW
ncbi:MAG: septum formation inhibitor Maf [Lachnospiraceae bacterium]|nr:septum formation inhibitor Maf [Lachnospiraceae bacterium]